MTVRSYRFAPPDRTGWLLGLGGAQVIALGGAVVIAVLLASVGLPLLVIAAPLAAGAAVALTRLGGRPLTEAAPPAAAYLARRIRRRHRWLAPLPLDGVGLTPPLPPCLDRQVFFEAQGAAVVCDRGAGRYAATIRVAG